MAQGFTSGIPLDTDVTLSADSNGLVSSQHAVKTYVDTEIASLPTITPAALTKTDDTNVTLTLGGTPATSLLQATSLTLGWTGTLADARIASASTWNAKQDALSGTGIVKSTAGTISYLTDNSANWDTAYTNRITSLTNTGTSGVATLIANTLNIPNYNVESFTIITSDVTTTSSSLSDVTGLSFPVTSGKTYRFSFMIPYTSSSTGNGALFSVNGASNSLLIYRCFIQTTTSQINYHANTYDAGTTATTSASGNNMSTIEGMLIASATGTVIARFASEVATTQSITAKSGASVYYKQLD